MRTPDPIGGERDREFLSRARARTQENIRRAREDEQDVVGYVIKGPTRLDDVIYPRARAVARAAALTSTSARRGLNEVYTACALVPVTADDPPEARWACIKCGITQRAASSRLCSVIGNESLMEHVWTVTL